MPFIDVVRHKVSILERQLPTASQDAITKDNVLVQVETSVFYRIIEPEKTVYRIRDVDGAISTTVAGIVRSEIGRMELDQVQSNRNELIGQIKVLVEDAVAMREQGFRGSKIKIGCEHISEDDARLGAVRAAVGPGYEIMTDANQGFVLSEAIRRARVLEQHDVCWFEEPLPADDVAGHVDLARRTSVPVAVGESLYSLSQFKDYLQAGAASVVQVDVARIGGVTPWLKVAHLAEAFNIMVCPHFLMELHVSLVCAVPNAKWLEYIPQLDTITRTAMRIDNGFAIASNEPGLGIDWDRDAISTNSLMSAALTEGS